MVTVGDVIDLAGPDDWISIMSVDGDELYLANVGEGLFSESLRKFDVCAIRPYYQVANKYHPMRLGYVLVI